MVLKMFKIGLEIEFIFNRNIIKDLEINRYHSERQKTAVPLWFCESDNSINLRHYLQPYSENSEVGAEFISKILKTKYQYDRAIKNFKNYFSKNGKYELKEVLDFNDSCGIHLHLSNNNIKNYKTTNWKTLLGARKLFFKLIKNSNINSKNDILNHYFRHYAKRSLKGSWRNIPRKYSEFNTLSEKEGLGLEWRSLNLLNLKTWAEFEEFFKILWKCIKYLINNSQKWSESTKINKNVDLNIFNTTAKEEIKINDINTTTQEKINICYNGSERYKDPVKYYKGAI